MKLSHLTDIADIALLIAFFTVGFGIPPFARAGYTVFKMSNKYFAKV